MDKIYSRRHIDFKIKKVNKNKKIKLIIIVILLIIVLFFIFLIKTILPVFKSNCISKANSIGVRIVNEEVRKVMTEYTYNDLIVVHTDNQGEITFLESNIIPLNEIIAKITSNIQSAIDKNETSKVYINMGTVSGVSVLKNMGPSVEIELETGGTVKATVNTEFSSVGINQTMHRVYVDVLTNIKIVTPIAVYNKELETRVLLAEAIVVGDIPETYYNLEGMNQDAAMEVME